MVTGSKAQIKNGKHRMNRNYTERILCKTCMSSPFGLPERELNEFKEPTSDERHTAAFLAGDDNAYWAISGGQRFNMYEDAVERAEALRIRVDEASSVIRSLEARLAEALAEIARLRNSPGEVKIEYWTEHDGYIDVHYSVGDKQYCAVSLPYRSSVL